MLEKDIQKQCLKWLNSLPESTFVKYHGTIYGKAGTLDLIGCISGQYFEIEIKRPKGVLTELQRRRIETVRKAGGQSFFVTSLSQLRNFMELLGYYETQAGKE